MAAKDSEAEGIHTDPLQDDRIKRYNEKISKIGFDPNKLSEGEFSTDRHKWPKLSSADFLNHILDRQSFDNIQDRTNFLQRADELFQDMSDTDILYTKKNGFHVLKAKVEYSIWLILRSDDSWETAYCPCMAGERCSHIASVLMALYRVRSGSEPSKIPPGYEHHCLVDSRDTISDEKRHSDKRIPHSKEFLTKRFQTNAMKYGQRYERKAKKKLLTILKEREKHKIVKQTKGVLECNDNNPEITAISDGKVTCESHGTRCVETKCPYTMRHRDKISVPWLKAEGDKMKLSKKHPNYKQVQRQLFTSGCEVCYFFVWCRKDCHLLEIDRDEEFMKEKFQGAKMPKRSLKSTASGRTDRPAGSRCGSPAPQRQGPSRSPTNSIYEVSVYQERSQLSATSHYSRYPIPDREGSASPRRDQSQSPARSHRSKGSGSPESSKESTSPAGDRQGSDCPARRRDGSGSPSRSRRGSSSPSGSRDSSSSPESSTESSQSSAISREWSHSSVIFPAGSEKSRSRSCTPVGRSRSSTPADSSRSGSPVNSSRSPSKRPAKSDVSGSPGNRSRSDNLTRVTYSPVPQRQGPSRSPTNSFYDGSVYPECSQLSATSHYSRYPIPDREGSASPRRDQSQSPARSHRSKGSGSPESGKGSTSPAGDRHRSDSPARRRDGSGSHSRSRRGSSSPSRSGESSSYPESSTESSLGPSRIKQGSAGSLGSRYGSQSPTANRKVTMSFLESREGSQSSARSREGPHNSVIFPAGSEKSRSRSCTPVGRSRSSTPADSSRSGSPVNSSRSPSKSPAKSDVSGSPGNRSRSDNLTRVTYDDLLGDIDDISSDDEEKNDKQTTDGDNKDDIRRKDDTEEKEEKERKPLVDESYEDNQETDEQPGTRIEIEKPSVETRPFDPVTYQDKIDEVAPLDDEERIITKESRKRQRVSRECENSKRWKMWKENEKKVEAGNLEGIDDEEDNEGSSVLVKKGESSLEGSSLIMTPNQPVTGEVTPSSAAGRSTFAGEGVATIAAHGQVTTPRQLPSSGSSPRSAPTMAPTQTSTTSRPLNLIATPEFGTLTADDLRQVPSPVLTKLASLVREQRQNSNLQLGSENNHWQEESTGSLTQQKAAEEESTGTGEKRNQESLLEQLLPREEKNASRKRKTDSPVHLATEKVSRLRSPSPVQITTNQIVDAVRSGTIHLQDRITDNTITLHSLEESVKDLSAAVRELTCVIQQKTTAEDRKTSSESSRSLKENRDAAKDRQERRKSEEKRL